MIHELGELLAESSAVRATSPNWSSPTSTAGALRQERMRIGTFNDAARARRASRDALPPHRASTHKPDFADVGLERDIRRFPFVPNTPEKLDADCYEAFNIQVEGLRQAHRRGDRRERLVIGVSGGLDSTHALIVAAKAMDRLGRPRDRHPRLHHARLRDRRGHQVATPGR